ncbi:MAG: S-layer y domain protein [Firmicutes bacterium]|nr:S-layer y domain protein [Bacillota bacterium]
MRKNFTAAMVIVLALGIGGGTSFAANDNPHSGPFGDLSDAWIYQAMVKLSKEGIIQGYSVSSFRGDKTATRYEMAKLVAEAVKKEEEASDNDKELIDKLAIEFSKELTALNVRVAKLEQETEKLTFMGINMAKYEYHSNFNISGSAAFLHYPKAFSYRGMNKVSIFGTYKVNDDWNLQTMYQFNRDWSMGSQAGWIRSGDDQLCDGSVQGKIGAVGVQVGRFAWMDPCDAFVMKGDFTGVQFSYGQKVNVTLNHGYMLKHAQQNHYEAPFIDSEPEYNSIALHWSISPGQPPISPPPSIQSGPPVGGEKGAAGPPTGPEAAPQGPLGAPGSTNLSAVLHRISNRAAPGEGKDYAEVGFSTSVAKDLLLSIDATRSTYSTDNDAYYINLRYGASIPFVKGSHDFFASYSRMERNTFIYSNADWADCEFGGQGYEVGYHVCPFSGHLITLRWFVTRSTTAGTDYHDRSVRVQWDSMF